MNDQTPNAERLDEAVSKRLAKLAGMPVDSTQLQRRLHARLGLTKHDRRRLVLRHWLRPLGTVAAAILILGLVGWVFVVGGSPAVAAPSDMARIYQDMVTGEVHRQMVTDVAEANRQIRAQWSQAPQIPRPQSVDISSCCLHHVKGVTVAAVLMEYRGEPVTLVVALGQELSSADGPSIVRGGRSFTAHEQDGLQMVMTHEDQRWLCVMGKLPIEQLVDLAVDIDY
jgi:hypothetical protein